MVGSQSVQMRAMVRAQTIDGAVKPRQVFWTTPERARHYIDQGIAQYISVPVLPSEQPTGGPQETKKYSPDLTDGQSIDSAVSKESGKEEPSSVAPPDQASTSNNQRSLTKPFRKGKRRR